MPLASLAMVMPTIGRVPNCPSLASSDGANLSDFGTTDSQASGENQLALVRDNRFHGMSPEPEKTSCPDGQFRCRKCSLLLAVQEQDPHKPGQCKKDSLSYKGLNDRWQRDCKLKLWWDSLNLAAQGQWYRTQHHNPSGSKRKYDALNVQDSSLDKAYNGEEDVDMFVPYDIFEQKCIALGMKIPEAQSAFRTMVEDPFIECKWRRNQWLVPQYQGVCVCAHRKADGANFGDPPLHRN